jgi:CRP-like cAMP-binding protein
MLPAESTEANTPFFRKLSAEDADALLKLGTPRTFGAKHALARELQVPDRVFLLRSGWVKVCSTTGEGKDVILALRGPDDLVGEQSALDEQPRSASILPLMAVEAVAMEASAFRGFLAGHPAAALALMSTLSERLRDADAGRKEQVELTTWSRLALRIVEGAERFGEPDGDVVVFRLFTQQELADWTGASLESVGRALQMMRDLGWIETARGTIRVLDLEALRRAAD